MRRILQESIIWLIAMQGVLSLFGQETAEYHLFTNKEGQELEATVRGVSLETGRVTIVRRDGKHYELAGNLFSLDDQVFLKNWYKRKFGPSQGSIRFLGNPANDRVIDVIAAEGFNDLVALHALKDGWIARRVGGSFHFSSDRKQGFSDISHVSANTVWFVATKKDGTVWDSVSNQVLPGILTDIVAASAGAGHAIAIRRDGSVVVWGKRYGDDRNRIYDSPLELSEIVDVAASQYHVAAANRAGEVFFWKAGEADVESRSFGDGVVDIEGSIFDFLALTKSGEVYQWGQSGLDSARVPAALGSQGPFQKIRCNGSSRAAQKMDGSWIAWGKNAAGIVDHINGLGPVIDLAFISEPGDGDFGYVVWIEPETAGSTPVD